MKIVYIVTRANPIGGVQIHIRDLSKALQLRGHHATVVTGGTGPLVEQLAAQGTPTVILKHLILPINPVRDFLALREIRAALKRLRPDLVAVHSSKAGVLGRLAARSLGFPVLLTAHGWNFTPGIPPIQAAAYLRIERLVGQLADRIITVSEFDRALAIKSGITTSDRIVAVHNGMPDVPPELRSDPGRSPPRLVMIARFGAQKDHPTLFRALAGLQHYQWTLDLVGDGPLLEQMRSLSKELGIAERLRFLGQRMDVAQILAQSQVSILTSNWEGFPRSILEAMRAGLPVVASEVGGIGEAIQDGESGYVVPRGNVDLVRERLGRLLGDSDLRVQLGKNGRQRYEDRFTLGRCFTKTLQVYLEIIAQHTSNGASAPLPHFAASDLPIRHQDTG
jgi:glycosyltransferase involved in cell wall biosynthesis